MQEGYNDPPSVSSINRLIRGDRREDDGRKDYSIHGILGGKTCSSFPTMLRFLLLLENESNSYVKPQKRPEKGLG